MAKRSANFLIVSLLTGVLCFSCSKETSFTPFCSPERWFPLEAGNYWIYRNYSVYADGSVDEGRTDSLYITGDTLMLGYRYFHLTGTFHAKPISKYLAYVNGSVTSSDHFVFFDCPQVFPSQKLYPIIDFDFPGTIRTTRIDTLLSLPAGDFKPVMLYEAHSMLDDTLWIVTYKTWFARSTGIVKFSARCVGCDYENFTELIRCGLADQRK